MKHIKDIGTYLKYLKTRPMKIAWLLGVKAVLALGCYYIFSDIDGFNTNNPTIWLVIICVFITAINYIAMYQPYKEWKDGLEEEARLQIIKDNFIKNNK